MSRKCSPVLSMLKGWVRAPRWKWQTLCFHLASFIAETNQNTKANANTHAKKPYFGNMLEHF